LSSLAPLEVSATPYPAGTKVYRYTVRWVLELKDKPTPAGGEGAEQGGDGSQVSGTAPAGSDGEVRS
jgi:hypothetical protein